MVYTTSLLNSILADLEHRHIYMVIAEVVTLFLYVISMAFLPEYFGASFILVVTFRAE